MLVEEQALIAFFERVAKKDTMQLELLNQEPCFNLEQQRWTFKLVDLHIFLQRQYSDTFAVIEYNQFRQLVFNAAINQAVKLHGAEIIIVGNRSKVDKSEYALVWRTVN